MPALAPFFPFFVQPPSVYTTGRSPEEESSLLKDDIEELVQLEPIPEFL